MNEWMVCPRCGCDDYQEFDECPVCRRDGIHVTAEHVRDVQRRRLRPRGGVRVEVDGLPGRVVRNTMQRWS